MPKVWVLRCAQWIKHFVQIPLACLFNIIYKIVLLFAYQSRAGIHFCSCNVENGLGVTWHYSLFVLFQNLSFLGSSENDHSPTFLLLRGRGWVVHIFV